VSFEETDFIAASPHSSLFLKRKSTVVTRRFFKGVEEKKDV
jgi:hypothetical protein